MKSIQTSNVHGIQPKVLVKVNHFLVVILLGMINVTYSMETTALGKTPLTPVWTLPAQG